MNWLLIAPTDEEKACKIVEDSLGSNYGVQFYEIFIGPDTTKEDVFDDLKHIMQSTHCVIVNSAKLERLPDYTFMVGALAGKQIITFVYDGGSSEKRYETLEQNSRATFRCFSDFDDMVTVLNDDYIFYRQEDDQRQALVQLFSLGIPFTSDCFAQYIAKDNSDICQLFFEAGMIVNARTTDGVPLICVATRNDCVDKVKWLVENGADINEVSTDRGYSAVMDAVWRKNVEITRFLVEHGADLHFISSDGQPILVLAVGNGNVEIVRMLLEHGADPDVADSMGMTARGYAKLFKKPAMIALMDEFPPKG